MLVKDLKGIISGTIEVYHWEAMFLEYYSTYHGSVNSIPAHLLNYPVFHIGVNEFGCLSLYLK